MKQNKKPKILVVGAGPVGLALAVELVRRGYRPAIVDKGIGPTPLHESRALAVNQRSQDLLKPSGIDKLIVKQGYQVKQAQFYWNNTQLFSLEVYDEMQPDRRLITLPQGHLEQLFLSFLASHEIYPQWQCEVVEVGRDFSKPHVVLRMRDGQISLHNYDFVAGCDGAHSIIRKTLDVGFDGFSTDQQWSLIDVDYGKDLSNGQVKAKMSQGVARGQLPVNETTLRFISNRSDVENDIPYREMVKNIPWKSSFKISYRLVDQFSKGNVYLCGDAAHIHSPAGGRGMNLGIEDACWLAWCIDENQLDKYNSVRLIAAKHVLKQTRMQTRVITGKIRFASLIIQYFGPLISKLKFVQRAALKNLLGLDTKAPPWL